MNIHPLFVHIPIGILTLYTFFEVFRVRFITKQSYYFELKTILVIFGTAASYLTAMTGDIAEELATAGNNAVISQSEMATLETHALYAGITITVFSLLAGSYLFEYLQKQHWLSFLTRLTFIQKVSTFIQRIALPLALVGMTLLIITGGLGASLVYGPDFDPLVTIIYNIFAS